MIKCQYLSNRSDIDVHIFDANTHKRERSETYTRKRVLEVRDPVLFRLTQLPCMPLRNALNLGPICQRYL